MDKQAMSEQQDTFASRDECLVALARMAAGAIAVARYPVVEVLRTCALQTLPDSRSLLRSPFNAIHASMHRWTHEDRTFVTPSNDFLYLNGWIDLTKGPVTLDIPVMENDRYYVVELLDAFTNNFINLSPRNAGVRGGRFVLHPRGTVPEPGDHEAVACPTDLVWLLGRVLVKGDDDLACAQRVAKAFRLSGAVCTWPSSIQKWKKGGDPALDFFQNVFNSLVDVPMQEDEAAVVGMLARFFGRGGGSIDVAALPTRGRAASDRRVFRKPRTERVGLQSESWPLRTRSLAARVRGVQGNWGACSRRGCLRYRRFRRRWYAPRWRQEVRAPLSGGATAARGCDVVAIALRGRPLFCR
jgi:hypothetical protein